MLNVIFSGHPSKRQEIVFDVAPCVRPPCIRRGDFKLIGKELYNIQSDPGEKQDVSKDHPDLVKSLQQELVRLAQQRPPLGDKPMLMTPALPWVYGQNENRQAPEWLKRRVQQVRAGQPTEWAAGTTPWPQAPKDGKIIYTGDGR